VQEDQVPGWGFGSGPPVEEARSMGEGFSDFLAAAMTGDPCWSEWSRGSGSMACGGGPGIRWLSNTNLYPADFEACPDRSDGAEQEHCGGLIWGAALWDMVESLGGDQAARDLVLRLVLDSHFYLDPLSTFSEAAAAIVQADLDLYAGEHVSTIEAVFAGRGINPGAVADFPLIYFRVLHPSRGQLELTLKIGDLTQPDCWIPIYGADPFVSGSDYIGYFNPDETFCIGYLPPSPQRPWSLEVRDTLASNIGQIADFQVQLSGTKRCRADGLPITIPDAGPAVVARVDCSHPLIAPGIPTWTPTPTFTPGPETSTFTPPAGTTPTPPTATMTSTPNATPTPTETLAPTDTPTDTPTATDTPTFTPTLTLTPTRTPTVQLRRGDANCNGGVTSTDAALILQLDARIVLVVGCPHNADADGDGVIGPLDALLVLQYDAGILAELPEVA
jgi:hypothetical protein